MTLLIDNYDSFTFNLYQMIEELGSSCRVVRNDQISLGEIENLNPDQIVLSPGPGTPDEAGITVEVIQHFAGKIPILGVCLGHQAIAQAFGGRIIKAPRPQHGKPSLIFHQGKEATTGANSVTALQSPFTATRYHSLIVERESLPECLEITCQTKDRLIMGLKHRDYPVEGVQFHPESVATTHGREILKSFLQQGVNP